MTDVINNMVDKNKVGIFPMHEEWIDIGNKENLLKARKNQKNQMNKIYIIAETACSHDGSVNLLKKMIREAIKANFQAIQLQIWG